MPEKTTFTLTEVAAIMKKAYIDVVKAQLTSVSYEAFVQKYDYEWYFKLLYSGQLSVDAVHQMLHLKNPDDIAWMHGGHRDAPVTGLCYWCAEEIIGPGAGRVNDLCVPSRVGKPKRKLACRWCGSGLFNRKGERIGDWNNGPLRDST